MSERIIELIRLSGKEEKAPKNRIVFRMVVKDFYSFFNMLVHILGLGWWLGWGIVPDRQKSSSQAQSTVSVSANGTRSTAHGQRPRSRPRPRHTATAHGHGHGTRHTATVNGHGHGTRHTATETRMRQPGKVRAGAGFVCF